MVSFSTSFIVFWSFFLQRFIFDCFLIFFLFVVTRKGKRFFAKMYVVIFVKMFAVFYDVLVDILRVNNVVFTSNKGATKHVW